MRRVALLATSLASLATAAFSPPSAAQEAGAPDIDGAVRRGVAFLVESQNKDGSWGSTASTLSDIYAPVPGSYYTFQVASSALALSALLEVGEGEPGATEAARRGADFLLARHAVRRVSQDTLYNIWAHAYSLEAFARLIAREKDPGRREALVTAAREDVELLERFEFVDGGWGYYDFDAPAKHPGPGATSFTTATALVALRMAAGQGVEVPARLVERAARLIRECEKPDGSYVYSLDLRFWPHMPVNKTKGSLARTPACLSGLLAAGEDVPAGRIEEAFENLESQGHFLRIARKYTIPHETWYQNSGYFCFYGYYYASGLFSRLSKERRRIEAARIAGHLVPLQEKDGSWWDYQLFGYHKPYGTGFVLLTLGRCRRVGG